ncbi:stage V sporulation protein B [Jeotgalibacillus sp. R-1-5s-1]|uniref:stage V sporulation protein B n=1 Tax=Jeotgalibacillus sp. R-1-5s-1 TaxID=2555897 RepID=UPI00141BB484|nr:stage V sporulation protein B [Jeotgalibacillus sp. R-1-5s-1]
MSTFIKGTLLLMVAALATKILGFVHRIMLAGLTGEEGVGLYMMTFPALMLAITVTQLGLPIAISKYVSEAEAKKKPHEVRNILTASLWITGSLACLLTPVLFFSAPFIANVLLDNNRTLIPFIAVLPVVPIAAFSAVLRGYFMGKQKMGVTATGSVIEQLVRIFLLTWIVSALMERGIEYAAAGAMIASVAGELVSLLFLLTVFYITKRPVRMKKPVMFTATSKKLLSIALPSAGSRMVGSAAWFLEPIIVMKCLMMTGLTASYVTGQYGLLTGFILPVLLLPSFITVSLSTALVPSISEALAKKQLQTVEHRVHQALRISLVTGALFSLLLFMEGEYFLQLLYHTSNGQDILKLLSALFIFYYYQGPLHAVMQAFEAAGTAMINSIIGAIVKLAVMAILLLQMENIIGAAIGIAAGVITVTFLHFHSIRTMIKLTIPYGQYVATGFLLVLCYLIHQLIVPYASSPERIFILTVCFIVFASGLQLIKKEDWFIFGKSFRKS